MRVNVSQFVKTAIVQPTSPGMRFFSSVVRRAGIEQDLGVVSLALLEGFGMDSKFFTGRMEDRDFYKLALQDIYDKVDEVKKRAINVNTTNIERDLEKLLNAMEKVGSTCFTSPERGLVTITFNDKHSITADPESLRRDLLRMIQIPLQNVKYELYSIASDLEKQGEADLSLDFNKLYYCKTRQISALNDALTLKNQEKDLKTDHSFERRYSDLKLNFDKAGEIVCNDAIASKILCCESLTEVMAKVVAIMKKTANREKLSESQSESDGIFSSLRSDVKDEGKSRLNVSEREENE